MYRGTTPAITLTVEDIDLTALTGIYITFRQGTALLTKRSGEEGITVKPHTITVQLSQADTLALKPGAIQVQLRAVNAAGMAFASMIRQISVQDILLDGEIP